MFQNRPVKRLKINNANGKTRTSNGENGYSSGDAATDSIIGSTCCSSGDMISCNLGNTNDPLMNGNDSNNNDSNGNTLCHNLNSVQQMNGNSSHRVSSEITAVRRSARSRRGDKKIEINASSSMVLLDIKKKVSTSYRSRAYF